MKENSQEASADPAPTDRRVIRGAHSAAETKGKPSGTSGRDVRYRPLYRVWY